MYINYKEKNKKERGFTLIEMIVAIGVFAVAMTISVGAVLSISAAQKRAIAIQNVQDNIRFAIESMSKEARVGNQFQCLAAPVNDLRSISPNPRSCASGGALIAFFNSRGERTGYQLRSGQIERWSETNVAFFPITSQNVSIERLTFYVLGAEAGDGLQPRILITAEGKAQIKNQLIDVNLQITVSQRLLDS